MIEKYKDLSDDPMVYAVGDGNHSLATAKACYEKLKQKSSMGTYQGPSSEICIGRTRESA